MSVRETRKKLNIEQLMRDKLRRLHEGMNVDKETLGSICSRTRSYEHYLEEVYVFSTDRISNEKRFEIEGTVFYF